MGTPLLERHIQGSSQKIFSGCDLEKFVHFLKGLVKNNPEI